MLPLLSQNMVRSDALTQVQQYQQQHEHPFWMNSEPEKPQCDGCDTSPSRFAGFLQC